MTIDIRVAGIGLSTVEPYPPKRYGAFIKGGIKFLLKPLDSIKTGYNSLIKGFYFRPDLNVNYYPTHFSTGLLFNLGSQGNITPTITIDFFAGLGYTILNFDSGGNSYRVYKFSYVDVSQDFPLAFTSGLSIGFMGYKQKSRD